MAIDRCECHFIQTLMRDIGLTKHILVEKVSGQ